MSYNYYKRPQDRDGNKHAGAVGRGRSQHQATSSHSRGRILDRSYDFHDMRNRHRYDERDRSNIERRSDHYHASRSSNQPYASSHHRSCDPPLSQYASSSRDYSYQRNSSHSRKRSRSSNHQRNVQSNHNNNMYDQSRRPRSFYGCESKHASYEHHPLASTNGAEMHRAPSLMRSNDFQRHNNTENHANISCVGGHMSNMNSYHSHYHQPQSRYDHPKSTSHERHPLASRQDFSSYPRLGQQQGSWPTAPRFSNDHTIPELIQIAHANLAAMKPSLTAAFWNKVLKQMSGRNAPNNPRLPNHREELGRHLHQIYEHTQNTLMLFSAKDLSQVIYSMAKLVDVLRKRNGKRCVEDTDVSLSGLLLNHDMTLNEDLFQSFASASRDKLHHFDARGLSNLAYAYALIGYVPEFDDESDLFDHIATQAAERRAHFEPQNAQDISNMVWAYATVNKPHALLFEAMGNQVVAFKHLGEFKPQDFANTVWAYATADISHPILFEKVAIHIVGLDSLDRFDPQALSNTVWAYATAGVHHPNLFKKVANHIVGLDSLDRFNPQNRSNAVWAYATAGIYHPKLFEKVANHIVGLDSLDRFKPQELTNTVWAYATAQVSHPKLFQKVAFAATQRREEFNSQGVTNLLWAYATMGVVDKQLFLSFVPTAAKLIDSDTNQGLANIAWAYAVANVDAPTLFNAVFINMCIEKKEKGGFESEALRQLHQWHLWQTKEKFHDGMPEELQDRCYNVFISEEPTASKLQDDVVAQLSSIGLEPKEEVLMGSGYRIDAVVEVNGKQVGIEVDGPFHFIGGSRLPLGSTILKRRQVPSIDGIELVSVPYWEWDKLGKDEVKKQEYLRELLKL